MIQADARPVALVTGSSSGIGEATARRLASDGFTVVVTSRSSVAAGQRVAQEINGRYLQTDLGNAKEAEQLPRRAVELTGRLDVLINNAAITATVPHDDLAAATPDLWRRMLDVNLLAPWLLTTAAEQHLRSSPIGCIVNVTSHAGVRPKGASIPYAAIKAALGHTTKLLAVALAPDIRVNAVAPGLVDTPHDGRLGCGADTVERARSYAPGGQTFGRR